MGSNEILQRTAKTLTSDYKIVPRSQHTPYQQAVLDRNGAILEKINS